MKTIIAILLFLPAIAFSQSPGGVSSNIQLWLKANDGALTSGAPSANGQGVSVWQDKSGVRARNATDTLTNEISPITIIVPPTFRLNAIDNINYNPVVDFDGVDDGLDYRNDYVFSSGAGTQDGMTWLALLQPDAASPDKSVQFVFDLGGYLTQGYGMAYGSSNYRFHTPTASGAENVGTHSFSTQTVLTNFTIDFGNTQSFAVNGSAPLATANISGLTKITSTEVSANPVHRGLQGPFTIGRQSKSGNLEDQAGRLFDGSIAELIGFNKVLTAAELKRVESYLGIKYGITLSNAGGDTNGDYISSGGTTVWDADNGSGYHNSVIGISQDNSSGLLQKQSHQPNDSTRIYIGTLAATNAANTGSFASNNQFVLMGNDGATIANNTGNAEYPAGLNIANRVNREWKITNTAFTGNFSIDVKPLAGTYTPAQIGILIDDDGDFSNAVLYRPNAAYSDGMLTISGITTAMIPASSTRYLTIVTVNNVPGAIGNGLTLWLKTDAGITQSGGSVSQWNDQSSSGFHVSQATASRRPLLSADTLNYYAVPAFDGVDDTLANTSIPYSGIMNVTGGISDATTGSLFTVARVKSLSTDSRIIYQWNTAPTGSFVLQSFVDNTTGELKVGGRGALNGINTLPDLKPFIATALETSGANNALHYYNGGSQKNGTTVSNNAYTGTNFLRVGAKLNGYVAEAIAYNVKLTDLQRRQVESYLAIKYGITMNNTGGGTFGDYVSTAGTTLWDASDNSSYHNQVIGIGRDDNTALLQKQSHTIDDSTRIYLSALQAVNTGNNGSFASNGSFVITGNNGGQMFSTGSTEYPSGNGIYSRLDREWKITNTGFSGTFSMDFTLKAAPINASDLKIMIDADDGNFNNAVLYTPSISYSGGVVTVSGITNAMIPSGSTHYLTLVSMQSATPLPVSLTTFTATVQDKTVLLQWQTATEQNNAYFAVERSADGLSWQQIGKVAGAGNSSRALHYSYLDEQPVTGTSHYRLKQTDLDGTYKYSFVNSIRLYAEEDIVQIYPNPVTNEVTIEGKDIDAQKLRAYDFIGRDITSKLQVRNNGYNQAVINMTALPDGLYILKVNGRSYKVMKK